MVRLVFTDHSIRRLHVASATGVVVLAGVLVALYAMNRPEPVSAPTYDVVLPYEHTVDDLGGWRRVSPAEKEPVFAYEDSIGDVPISVSQQPIPESFSGNVAGSVREIAEQGSYSNVIEAGDTQIYIGRSARGPQSVVLAKNNVLIFIKSQKTISNAEWARYIERLVDPTDDKIPTF